MPEGEPKRSDGAIWLETTIDILGVSWRKFAKGAGVSVSSLSAYRLGKIDQLTEGTWMRIGNYLGMDIWDIMRIAGYQPKDQSQPPSADPKFDVLVQQLRRLTPQERAPVMAFGRFVVSEAFAARRLRQP